MCEGACEWVTRHLTKVRNDNKWQELVGFAVRIWGSLRIGMEYIYVYDKHWWGPSKRLQRG